MFPPTVLVVDADPDIRRLLERILGQQYPGASIVSAATVAAALARLEHAEPGLIVTGYYLIDGTAHALIAAAHIRAPSLPIVVLSADSAVADAVLAAGAYAFVRKPFAVTALLELVRGILGPP